MIFRCILLCSVLHVDVHAPSGLGLLTDTARRRRVRRAEGHEHLGGLSMSCGGGGFSAASAEEETALSSLTVLSPTRTLLIGTDPATPDASRARGCLTRCRSKPGAFCCGRYEAEARRLISAHDDDGNYFLGVRKPSIIRRVSDLQDFDTYPLFV
jgi:hypothetical protein